MTIYNKLVRDKIPDIIKAHGGTPQTHRATEPEYLEFLYAKVIEELDEYKAQPSAEEMADIIEVLRSLVLYHGINWDSIEPVREHKRQERGGFDERIILEQS